MGKICRLSERPSCFEATIKLIEKSFHYKGPNSFEIDFAPLIDKSNHHNCFIMLDETENVVAHIGVKERIIRLANQEFPIALLGGIAVDETRRGEGHFQALFQDVLAEKKSDTTFFLLWSDLEKLYNKFGFHLCGTQIEVNESPSHSSSFEKTRFNALSNEEKEQIKLLYSTSFKNIYLSLERTNEDWALIEKISSAELFIKKTGSKIESYFFMNKGQDLPGIIYEYGTNEGMVKVIKELSSFGKVWLGKDLLPSENLQYQFFMSPGDLKLFTRFVEAMTGGKFVIRNINLMKQEVFFDFEEETLSLELPDFLRGVFGPGTFEEIDAPAFFISGLDSI